MAAAAAAAGSSGAPNSAAAAGGWRLPGRVLEFVFSYLDLRELRSCALVRAIQHAFSTNDCSRNVYIKKNGFTLHRNPIAQSTDGARTKIGFSEGRHAWEVWWEGPLGTVAVIGIATKRAPMQCQGYVALLGSDDQSWGWNLVDNNLLHNGEVNGSFPQCNNAPKYQIGERIRVILDMEDKTLAFERGYEFLGVAFRGLPKTCLYPAVSAVYGNTEQEHENQVDNVEKPAYWLTGQHEENTWMCAQETKTCD
ncbi:F-box/SPRY domain-containing protein 1 isoform X2 [Thamnophis elegans]|uniref:F-box/SPRY domain-containing protein 1 isoform X2 n=1 Tax=Thamnophis elegans TaxID=35005 RepID=UPI0013777395|nr:F-box/SPRY domain-containing protein 1 isoform X2 [Thamnophis elegans]